ncbi:MAG TPA: DUF6230 family protein [Nocardioides sp.]
MTSEARFGTRWGRSAGAMVAGIAVLTCFGLAIWREAFGLDATLVIQNKGVSFATSRIIATDAGFGMTVVKGKDGNVRNVLRAGFAGATMNGICISKTESVAGFSALTITLTGGDGNNTSNEITASNAAFDVAELNAKGSGIQLQGSAQIGLSTPDITTVPGAPPFSRNPLGQTNSAFTNGLLEDYDSSIWNMSLNGGRMNGQGFTGIDATKATLTTVYGKLLQAQIVGNITLPNLKISVAAGAVDSCETKAVNAGWSGGYFPGIS